MLAKIVGGATNLAARGRLTRLSAAVLALSILSACSGVSEQPADQANPAGSSFTNALARDYRSFTNFEANKMYDWIDADHFADKALRAQGGEAVAPERLDDWDLPGDTVNELTGARQRLVSVLAGDARERYPNITARAQSRFDCWVEQQEENHQPTHIAVCRDGFYEAMAMLDTRLAAKDTAGEAPVAAAEPESVTVFFDFDSADLSPASRAVVERAATSAQADGRDLYVTGFADSAGSADYNMELSMRRAKAVESALASNGLTDAEIGVAARGENDLAVPTENGVRMPANRRVEIVLD